MNSLLFLSNELVHHKLQNDMRLPLDFVTYAHIKGKMYSHFRKYSTFNMTNQRVWGNGVIYGAIYSLRDFQFYIRILDAYQLCSTSTLGRNHVNDVHHRVQLEATPISFESIDELERLQYREREEVTVHVYVGNLNHPNINQRLTKTNSYRIIDGMDESLKQVIREEME